MKIIKNIKDFDINITLTLKESQSLLKLIDGVDDRETRRIKTFITNSINKITE